MNTAWATMPLSEVKEVEKAESRTYTVWDVTVTIFLHVPWLLDQTIHPGVTVKEGAADTVHADPEVVIVLDLSQSIWYNGPELW